jgi:hypothetical protein
MRRKHTLLKLVLLQEKHKTIRELIQSETDHEKLRMYKAELESIASELRDLHQRIQDRFSYRDAAWFWTDKKERKKVAVCRRSCHAKTTAGNRLFFRRPVFGLLYQIRGTP